MKSTSLTRATRRGLGTCALAKLAVVLGCGGHPPPTGTTVTTTPPVVDAATIEPTPLDQDLDRLATRSIALFGELAKLLAAADDDCAAMTSKLGELDTRYADVIAANAKVLHDGREMQLKLALRHYDDQFRDAAKMIVDAKVVATCAHDQAFTSALDRLSGPR